MPNKFKALAIALIFILRTQSICATRADHGDDVPQLVHLETLRAKRVKRSRRVASINNTPNNLVSISVSVVRLCHQALDVV
jgi:hypothetical protein